MTRTVRDRASFGALARAPVAVGECVRVRRIGPRGAGGDGPPEVAYAVGRHVGGAVTRNRVRRRLRAAVGVIEPELQPGERILVIAGRRCGRAPFDELCEELRRVVRAAREAGE